MPQSWPSQWTILFIYFTIIILMMVILNFFTMSISTQKSAKTTTNVTFFSWQW